VKLQNRLPRLEEVEAVMGYWSRTFIGWVACHDPIPLIRHDVTWEPIADQAAARAVPLEQARRAGPPLWC
jgi:hypothetical protein